jgi:hypothetical protein
MKKAVALILIFLLLDVPDNIARLSEILSPSEAEAANWVCGQDLNGNGYVGDPGETAQCIATGQGQLCPIGIADCSTTQVCPLGNFPCGGDVCTQTGTCSPVQVQLSQYQCPATGQVYPDQTSCDSNCLQTADCPAPALSGSASFPLSETSQCGSWFIHPTAHLSSISFSGSGSQLAVTGTYKADTCSYTRTSGIAISGADLSGNASFPLSETSQCGSLFIHPTANLTAISFAGSGNQLTITGTYKADTCSYQRTSGITISGADLSGGASFPFSETSQCGSYWFLYPTASLASLSFSGSANQLIIAGGYAANSCSYSRSSIITFGGILCPLAAGSACSGSPSTCTAQESCTVSNGTVTKYQCSIDGAKYDALDQCTAVCTKTASCGTGYDCPLGEQYVCMDNSGSMQCSSNQCVDIDANPGDITHVDDTMLQNDGPRDSSGNCLGQIYIFTGRGMRCQKPGVSDGFHNCCDNDGGSVMTDSTGTLAELQTAVSAVQTIYQMAQVAYYVDAILTTGAMPAGLSTASSAVQTAVYTGVVDNSVSAGLQAYIGGLFNPATIALSAAIYLITQFLLGNCDQQDMETSMLIASGYCHLVGEYCETKWPIVGCVQKAKGYCCFNSKMGRIIQEQGRPQLLSFQPAGAWGSGESPNCRGFMPEEFQMLDFSRIDLSEYFGDIQKDMTQKLQNMGTDATQKIQQFYQDTR